MRTRAAPVHLSRTLLSALRSFGCLAIVACAPAAALAQDARAPLVTDRPDFTESAAVVPRGSVQLETGYTATRESGATQHAIGEVLVRAGLAPRLELRLGFNSYVDAAQPAVAGREDAALGVKIALTRARGAAPETALLLGTSLPTGSAALRSNRPQPEAKLALAWSVSERLGLAGNLNYARPYDGVESFGEPSASLTISAAAGARIGVYFEGYGFAPERGADTAFLNAGATYLLHPDAQLDLRFGTGVTGSNARFIGLGLSRRF